MEDLAAPSASLLGIPPELRNRIYQQVFVGHETIVVDSAGFEEPSILLLSKQIRSEASGIFYSDIGFKVMFENFDPTIALRLCKKLRSLLNAKVIKRHPESVWFASADEQEPDWSNVLRWCRALHSHDVFLGFMGAQESSTTSKILDACEHLVMNGGNLPWAVIEETLELLHQALIDLDPAWE